MYVVTVAFIVKEEFVKKFAETIEVQARNSLEKERGCFQFDACFDPQDARRVFLFEAYFDEAAFDDHMQTEHFKEFDLLVKDWLVSKEVQTWIRD